MVLFEHDAHHRRSDNARPREKFYFYFGFKIENKRNLFLKRDLNLI